MQEMLHLSYTPLNDRLWEDRLLENYLWDDLNYPGTCYTYMKLVMVQLYRTQRFCVFCKNR